jgi:hypothetical protein
MRNGRIYCPCIRAWVISVHLSGRIGRHSAATHHQHFTVESKRARLTRGSRYHCYRAESISSRVVAERVLGIHHETSLKVRCASHVDNAIYGARRRIHDPFRRGVRTHCPLGTYRSSRIKLPYLVGRGYVDVEPAQDVHLVTCLRKATRQNRACRIPRPVVPSERGRGVCDRVVGEDASCGCGLPSSGAAHTIDLRSA